MRIRQTLTAFAVSPLASSQPSHLLGSSFGVPDNDQAFNYIVVGGGTAGLTLATRLAEHARAYTGRSRTDWQPLIDWGYITTAQTACKCLGGSSARHYMAYQRGSEASYERWANAIGHQSFGLDRFLRFFEKSVNFAPPNMSLCFSNGIPEYDPQVMGNGTGPLSVTFSHYVQAFGTWATRGLQAIGIPIVKGFQSGSLMGQLYSMITIDAQRMSRASSETSFLRQTLAYSNFIVYQSTKGLPYQISARKEIILVAGVLGSLQLLLVSGVGPAADLQSLEIPVVAERHGVGQGMEDHIYYDPSYRVNAPIMSALRSPDFAARVAEEYSQNAAGVYTNRTTDVLAWEKIPQHLRSNFSNTTIAALAGYPDDWPEIEYLSLSAYLGYQQAPAHDDPNDGYNYASLAVALCTPRSKRNLTDLADIKVAIARFMRVRWFWLSAAMQSFVIGEEAFPGAHIASDAEIEYIFRRSFNTIYHGARTFNTEGRVISVKQLRVVDASAFPLLPRGHPQATVYALAEKIACAITGAC
ncbi:hypothetical protein BDV06DRAFT_230264 [Aspergillus oleicola]